ncbi:hypothetical protein AS159_04170 [Thermotoga sp. Ku-13t]|uniref:hypothetical protein n=1 Tax=Thermotoga sp. Ku-13t TaxID=1755813 RepID=UPI0013EC244B|nr:hypothetical protein [Thermotoga sp. Ku-13t]KAF2958871.1 hypothetical protein AS159_04170 [Thermotoga sp. Ku-13t]
MGEWPRKVLRTSLYVSAILFLISGALAYVPTVYRYDPTTGLWKVVDKSESEIKVELPSAREFFNSNVSVPIAGTIVLEPPTSNHVDSQIVTIKSAGGGGKWYFYMAYPLDSVKRYYKIIAGQHEWIGRATVKSENNSLSVSFSLFDNWVASESHLHLFTEEPTNLSNSELAPGQFPYKRSYSTPVNQDTYTVTLPATEVSTIYILLHLKVYNGSNEETAWAGEEEETKMCIQVSNINVAWYVKKPGQYVAKFLTAAIVTASHPVLVTFSNFDDLSLEGGGEEKLPVYYSFAEDLSSVQSWIRATDLNNQSLTLQNGQMMNMLHKIVVGTQQAGTYRNTATVTFTLQAVQNHIEGESGQGGK